MPIIIHDDAIDAFEEALISGYLTDDPNSPYYAEHYQYLYHDDEGQVHFIHRETHRCLIVPKPRHVRLGAGIM